MARGFLDIAGTPSVKAAQAANGIVMRSTTNEAHTEPSQLTAAEAQFIAACDNFYLASVSETGWPYVQQRGGPPLHLEAFLELPATHNTALYGARDCSGLCAGSGTHRGT